MLTSVKVREDWCQTSARKAGLVGILHEHLMLELYQEMVCISNIAV
jgi:hypothetical protein